MRLRKQGGEKGGKDEEEEEEEEEEVKVEDFFSISPNHIFLRLGFNIGKWNIFFSLSIYTHKYPPTLSVSISPSN